MLFQPVETLPGYTVVDVRDPADMDERSRVSERLPGSNAAHLYRLRDPAAARLERGALLSRYAMRRAGDLQISRAADRFCIAIDLVGSGMPAYCFSLIHAGRMAVSIPHDRSSWTEAGPGSGPIHAGRPGTQLLTADDTARTNLWLSAARVDAALTASLHDGLRAPLNFAPIVDWAAGPGARLRPLLAYAAAEFAEPDGFSTHPAALAAFVDLFIHTALRLLPHNYVDALGRPDHPAPTHLRRAEAYVEAHAETPLRLEDIAAAAGCSVRSLQRAFRQFRDTTPHAAIQAARLDRARAELARGSAPVATIARHFGFTKTRRFALAYARRFGTPP